MPLGWIRHHQTLALSAFVAVFTIAEMQLRLLAAALDPIGSTRPPKPKVRLVSDSFGLLIEKDE